MTRLLALTQAIEKMAAELAQELLREPAFREELKRRARQGVNSAVPDPLDALPLTLTLSELAALYRLSAATVRRQVQQGTFPVPPWAKYPYRWRREDVIADIKRDRPERPRKPHGFAKRRL
jgi:hypothetical protein